MRIFTRRFWRLFLLILLLPPLLLSVALATLKTEAGRDWLVAQINRSGLVRLAALEGSPWGTLLVSGLVFENDSVRVDIDRLSVHLRPYALLARRLHVRTLEIDTLTIQSKPAPAQEYHPPADLRLPWAISLDRAFIGRLRSGGQEVRNVQVAFESSSRFHRLESLRFDSDYGQAYAEATLDGRAPFMSSASFGYEGEVEGRKVTAAGHATGELRALDLDLEARSGGEISSQIQGRLDLFAEHAYQILRSGKVRLREFDPARFNRAWPRARLDVQLDLTPTGEDAARGHLVIRNTAPASLDRQGIPLQALKVDLAYARETVTFKGLEIAVPGGARLGGSGQIAMGKVALDLQVAQLDLARLWSRQPQSALSGQVQIKGSWLAPDVRADISDTRHRAHLRADLGWKKVAGSQRLLVREAELARGNQRIAVQGEVALDAPHAFDLQGRLQGFDPAHWLSVPTGQISGQFSARGSALPQPRIELDFELQESRFNGQSLAGKGRVRVDRQRLADSDFWLALGRNRVVARGAFGQEGDRLQLALDVNDLGQLGQDFAGSAQGELTLSGALSQPRLTGELAVLDLRTPWGVSVQKMHVAGSGQEGDNAPLRLQVDANRLVYAQHELAALQVALDGARAAHTLALNLYGRQGQTPYVLQAKLAGAWAQGRWQGEVQQLQLDGAQTMALRAPVALSASAQTLHLAPAQIDLAGGQFNVQALQWQDGQWRSTGDFTGAALAPWLQLFQRDAGSDLVLGGHWNLHWRGVLDGEASIWRESGESLWQGQAIKRYSPALEAARIDLSARASQLEISAEARSARFGWANFSASTRLDAAGGLAASAPLQVQARGQIPDLAAFNVMTGPDFLLKGALDFDLVHEGPVQGGRWRGALAGRDLGVRDPQTGLDLHDGRLRLTLENRQAELQELFFRGGQGLVRGSGRVELNGDDPRGQAEVVFERLRLFGRPDFLLVLSGQAGLRVERGRIDLSGRLKADEGDLRYRSVDTPRLSDDVRVLGREKAQAQKLPQIGLQLDVDLGERFRFRGFGADAVLGGLLRLRAEPAKPLAANGIVEVTGGIYRAYGRKLDIEQGLLSFQGPIDNPGVDILAMRRNMTVEAGVQVQGSARNPRVQLYSEPTVPDNEKLSWLLFGHGTENMERSDSAILLQGLSALLSDDNGGPSLSERVLDTVGIEEVELKTVKSTDSKPTQVMTVSKRIGQNWQFSIEKSLNGLNDAVKLAYQLSRRWSLVSRWGTDESSIEATHTLRFD